MPEYFAVYRIKRNGKKENLPRYYRLCGKLSAENEQAALKKANESSSALYKKAALVTSKQWGGGVKIEAYMIKLAKDKHVKLKLSLIDLDVIELPAEKKQAKKSDAKTKSKK